MHRVGHRSMIDESHKGFFTLLHKKRRAWRDAIIAHQIRLPEIRVHLLLERLDLDFIVVDDLAG
jgi:hypothetical protein